VIAIFGHLVQDAFNMNPLRLFYLGLAWLCVGLGIVGIILPLLPTTPFLLVAVWAFSKSSPELAEKLRNHPKAGPYIRGWQDHGVIPPVGKFLAVTMMLSAGLYLTFFGPLPGWGVLGICTVLLVTSLYILTRPSGAPKE
jgi:uncharacterized protein